MVGHHGRSSQLFHGEPICDLIPDWLPLKTHFALNRVLKKSRGLASASKFGLPRRGLTPQNQTVIGAEGKMHCAKIGRACIFQHPVKTNFGTGQVFFWGGRVNVNLAPKKPGAINRKNGAILRKRKL